MKRMTSAMLVFVLMVLMTACSGRVDLPKAVSKEGITPYELSENEKFILQSFNMEDTSQMITFNAPKEAITLNVSVYRLEDGGKWSSIGGGGISIGEDRKPIEKLTGTFAMQLKDNYSIEFVIIAGGKASYKTDEILLDSEAMASTREFLQQSRDITINSEIPVALMVYDSGNSMKTYSLQDYFEPSKFEGMDFVQVVTLEFSDK